MKQILIMIFMLFANVGFTCAQNSHGIIRRKSSINLQHKDIKGEHKVKNSSKSSKNNSNSSKKRNRNHVEEFTNDDIPENVRVASQGAPQNIKIISVRSTTDGVYITVSAVKNSSFDWISINPETEIITKSGYLRIKGAYGIAFSPYRTHFSYNGEKKHFTLVFPPIPSYIRTFNLYEPGGWSFSGISWW